MKASNYALHYHNGAMAAESLIALIEAGLDWRETDKFGMTLEDSLSLGFSTRSSTIARTRQNPSKV